MTPRPLDVEVGFARDGSVSHLGAGSSAWGFGRTLFAPKAPISACKHPPQGLHTGTFRQPLLQTSSFLFLSLTDRRGQTPRAPALSLLLSHAHYAGSSPQLPVDVGQ